MHAADLLCKRAHLTPERIALVELETGERFTYSNLNERANKLANFMHDELGVQPGDRVSILAKNSIVYIDLFYGLPKIGAIFAPFNWRLTSRELTYMINDLQPKVLIVESEFVSVVEEMQSDINIDHFVNLRGAEIPKAMNYEDGLKQASS
ncbi:MAG TPA: AMP-binding protein, partial [Anaerolineales bacterium]|nr:AMP-binding protein [Anaerolineales bacterium]